MKPTTPPSRADSRRIEATAAEWVARRDAGLDPAATAQLLDWLQADPRHAEAFHALDAAWRTFDLPRARGTGAWMSRQLFLRHRRRRRATAAVATVAAAAAVWVLTIRMGWIGTGGVPGSPVAGAVVVLRPEHRILEDGTVVELNRGAKIQVEYSAGRRSVKLLQGDARFAVEKDPARPFVVTTPHSEFRDVGTVFAVGVGRTTVDLLVTEGCVAVKGASGSAVGTMTVSAGNRLVVPDNLTAASVLKVQPVSPEEIDRRLAWLAPRLDLSGTPLREVAAAFNRENRTQLTVGDDTLASLRLTGVFRADRVEDFVRLLEAHYGVRAVRHGPAEIVLQRQ